MLLPRDAFKWGGVADEAYSRLGGETNLAAIIERVMCTQGEAFIAELTTAYRRRFETILSWQRKTSGEIEQKIKKFENEFLAA